MIGGSRGSIDTVPAVRDISFRDLLSHTSGLTYGFMESNNVDAMYRATGVDFNWGSQTSLEGVVEELVRCPLIAQPGSEWNYSVSTDVLGYLVQVISGMPFADFLRDKVIEPLGMVDTDFFVPQAKLSRFAGNYAVKPGGGLNLIDDAQDSPRYNAMPPVASGGGGLVSTAHDYMRFCKFMLNKGELEGVRLLGRKAVELMTSNHLKGDMADMGQPTWSESPTNGIGFGLGFSVTLADSRHRWRIRLGRRCQHRLLVRSGGGYGRRLPHAVDAKQYLPGAPRVAGADVSGGGGLNATAAAYRAVQPG